MDTEQRSGSRRSAARPVERRRRRPGGPAGQAALLRHALRRARSGPYNVAPGPRQPRERGRDGQGRVRLLPRPGHAAPTAVRCPDAPASAPSYTTRNAPTVINAAYSPLWQFWDGRRDSLWSQARGPEGPPSATAVAWPSRTSLADQLPRPYERFRAAAAAPISPTDLRAIPGAPASRASPPFDGVSRMDATRDVNRIYVNFGKAIAAYERRLIEPAFEPSPFDSSWPATTDAMSPAAIRGARLFVGRAGCAECHHGPTFSDFRFHNVGAPQTGRVTCRPPTTAASAASESRPPPWATASSTAPAGSATSRRRSVDLARPLTRRRRTQRPTDSSRHRRCATSPRPPLTCTTAPTQTLWDVVNHYNFGGATGLRGREGSRASRRCCSRTPSWATWSSSCAPSTTTSPPYPALLNDPAQ